MHRFSSYYHTGDFHINTQTRFPFANNTGLLHSDSDFFLLCLCFFLLHAGQFPTGFPLTRQFWFFGFIRVHPIVFTTLFLSLRSLSCCDEIFNFLFFSLRVVAFILFSGSPLLRGCSEHLFDHAFIVLTSPPRCFGLGR